MRFKRFIKHLTAAAAALAVFGAGIFADRDASFLSASVYAETIASGTCGENVTWSLDGNGLLTIGGTGAMTDYDGGDARPYNDLSDIIKKVEIQNGVTSIGKYAFIRIGLTSVSIPNSVTHIGQDAFSSTKITSIDIPDSVTSMANRVFYSCGSLTSVKLPGSITSIPDELFAGCTSLASIDIHNNITSIGTKAFYNCSSLKTIDIPNSVTSIGWYAFDSCWSLKTIMIPESVTSIGRGLVDSCSAVLLLPDGVKYDCRNTQLQYKIVNNELNITRIEEIYYLDQIEIPNTLCGFSVTHVDESFRGNVAKTGHDHIDETAATCKTNAVCALCGDYGSPLGHDLTKTEEKPATCTDGGNTAYWTCSRCAKTFSDENGATETQNVQIAAKGHTVEKMSAVPATCTTDGKTAGEKCSACGTVLTEQTVVAAFGHSWNGGTVTKEPTEETDGVKTYTCTTCGDTKTESIAQLPHTHKFSNDWTSDDAEHWHAATCEHGDEVKDKSVHAWNNGEVTTEPTCTEKGEKTFTCTVCGRTRTEEIAAKGHAVEKTAAVSATCTTDGMTEGEKCSVCGAIITEQTIIAALGHAWNEGTVTKEPTVDEAGERSFECTVCGTTKTEPIDKIHTHNWSAEWSSDAAEHWHVCLGDCGEENGRAAHTWNSGTVTKQPTSTQTGERTYECTVCGATKTETIAATGSSGGSSGSGGSGRPSRPTTPVTGTISSAVKIASGSLKIEILTPSDDLAKAVLTVHERSLIYDGTDIEIILAVDEETVSAADKSKVETFCNAANLKVGKYFDMSLLKNIGGSEEKAAETSALVELRITLPKELQKDGRIFSVIRAHDGSTAVLADLDEDESTVTIETDKFSTYALVYSEKADDDDNTTSAPNEDDNSDTTSDNSEPTESGTSDTSSDNSEPTKNGTSDNTSSGETSDDNSGNPATGIAVSCLPMAMAVIVLTVAATRKKK